MIEINCNNTTDHSVVPFSTFLQQVGRSATCGWRWRKKGWVKTTNVAGRIYITRDEIDRFHQRAAAGEFATATVGHLKLKDAPKLADLAKAVTSGEYSSDNINNSKSINADKH